MSGTTGFFYQIDAVHYVYTYINVEMFPEDWQDCTNKPTILNQMRDFVLEFFGKHRERPEYYLNDFQVIHKDKLDETMIFSNYNYIIDLEGNILASKNYIARNIHDSPIFWSMYNENASLEEVKKEAQQKELSGFIYRYFDWNGDHLLCDIMEAPKPLSEFNPYAYPPTGTLFKIED